MQISRLTMRPRLCTFDKASTPKFLAFSSLTSIFLNDSRNSPACAYSSTIMYRHSNGTNEENRLILRSCTYRQNSSHHLINISTRRIVLLLLDREPTIGKGSWNWTPMDSDSALKRKCSSLGTSYVSNAENLGISHATVTFATLPTCKIINTYHMDTQGRKPGNCKGSTPPQTRKDLRRLVA